MRWFLTIGLLGLVVPGTAAEMYRLVHAVGNNETMIAVWLTKQQCKSRKAELIANGGIVVEGAREDPRLGTLTCLPEYLFE